MAGPRLPFEVIVNIFQDHKISFRKEAAPIAKVKSGFQKVPCSDVKKLDGIMLVLFLLDMT